MRRLLAFLLLGLGFVPHAEWSQSRTPAVQASTTTITIPTYPYAAFLETRHSDAYNMDYAWLNWSAYDAAGPHVPTPQDYTGLVVENVYLQLTFLPELGGRLYGVEVKATGEQLLYQNPVLKPTQWGPPEQSWWLAAGGVEWGLPVDEHGYEWGVPWSYDVLTTTRGVTVTLWDTEATDRVRARVAVFLPADRAAFEITPRLENPTGAAVSFKFWHNAMLAPGAANTVGPDLRFALPIDQVTVHSRGDDYLPGPGEAMDWPVHGGTDYARLGNWNQWLGAFARPQAAEGWTGIYDEATQRGVARAFPHQVAVGAKVFGFGWNDPISPETWTDDGSAYVELHGGPAPTFWDTITLDPGASLAWTETWLPLRDLPALSVATDEVALGLRADGADLHVGFVAAGQHDSLDARLWRRPGCALLWSVEGVSLSPGQAHSHQLADLELSADQVVLGIFEDGELLAVTDDQNCWPPETLWLHYLPLILK